MKKILVQTRLNGVIDCEEPRNYVGTRRDHVIKNRECSFLWDYGRLGTYSFFSLLASSSEQNTTLPGWHSRTREREASPGMILHAHILTSVISTIVGVNILAWPSNFVLDYCIFGEIHEQRKVKVATDVGKVFV